MLRALQLLCDREALAEHLQATAHRLDAELDEVWNYIYQRVSEPSPAGVRTGNTLALPGNAGGL